MRLTNGVFGLCFFTIVGCAGQMQMGGVATGISGSAGGADSATGIGPKCPTSIGPAALVEPDARVTSLLSRVGLQSPIPLLRLEMMQSNCFQVVDRGAAMGAVQQQEQLRSDGMLRDGTAARGRLVEARWLITPNIVFSEPNAGGSSVGGIVGGFFGPLGAMVGSALSSKVSEAQVVLFVTDAQTGIQAFAAEGSAKVRDFNGAGGLGGIGAGLIGFGGISGYSNTNEGKVITAALLDAYTKLVERFKTERVGANVPEKAATSQQADSSAQRFSASARQAPATLAVKGAKYLPTTTVNLRAAPGIAGSIVGQLARSNVVTALGDEHDGWWFVGTEKTRGWVLARNLSPAPSQERTAPR